ncbi:CBS domain-containing protein [Rhodospirillum rubrum]|uniref:CBS domain-containing protein n=1 Tax=Rhodospirillum rubrum TaxID=1085 RepID=UPI001906E2CA|nr:CBS domain-containing protein [Rhodospirillum rubrum]MBK1665750.1 CBS domain-containing protein [Rhodospirillum rubrum]MBK1678047.1 CBS domain-containing protein [Rhodospirillum rubrum]
MQRRIVPDVVRDQTIFFVSAETTAREVARTLADNKIAAVVVMEGGLLKGIITERDVTARLVAKGGDPDTVTARAIMTPDPDTLAPEDTAEDALRMMRLRGYRHLPVVDEEGVVAMVSIRDLYAVVTDQLERDMKTHESFIYGEQYGTS